MNKHSSPPLVDSTFVTQGHVYPSLFSKLQGRRKRVHEGGEMGGSEGWVQVFGNSWSVEKKKKKMGGEREQRDGEMEGMSEID